MKNKKLLITACISLTLSLGQFVIPGLRDALALAGGLALDAFVGERQSETSPFVFKNREVDQAIAVFRGPGRDFFSRALSNSGRYIDQVKQIFRAQGMPEPLAYLALIESGYNNNALSRASAVGMWQFMAATGQGCGLRIGYGLDERRDFIKATHAAVRHLKDLYTRFGDWYLALAAYNAGSGYIEARMRQTGTRDYWELAPHLYTETRLYVPRFLAACLIANNPDVFGFGRHEYKKPFFFHRTTVKGHTTLAALALKYKVPVAEMQKVNPHLVLGVVPATKEGIGVNIPLVDRSGWRPLATLAGIFHDPDNEG